MKVRGDIESVNLRTGVRFQRVTGEGESRLESSNQCPCYSRGERCELAEGHSGKHAARLRTWWDQGQQPKD